MTKKAFTLLELLLVVALMGILGSVMIGGYVAIHRGMEQRMNVQNVNQFVRSAYQRAQVDRKPVDVYFWNETLQAESDLENLIVVGKACAVRTYGRISEVNGKYLKDEFGDQKFSRLVEDADSDVDLEAVGDNETDDEDLIYIYNMRRGGTDRQRSLVSEFTQRSVTYDLLATDMSGSTYPIEAYAWVKAGTDSVDWRPGDPYGFVFEEIQLSHNYIFGRSYSARTSNPISEVDEGGVMRFDPVNVTGGGASADTRVQISALYPGREGNLEVKPITMSDDPRGDL